MAVVHDYLVDHCGVYFFWLGCWCLIDVCYRFFFTSTGVVPTGRQRVALESAAEVVAATAEGALLIAAGGGQVDCGGGVGRDDDVPGETVATALPMALDGAADGLVGAAEVVEPLDGMGFQLDAAVAILQGADAGQIFVVPRDEVAEEHDVVAGVHGGVAGVAIPQLPDGGGPLGCHVAPAGIGGVGGEMQR